MRAYYNEIDPFAAEWLRNLIKAGLILEGEVDERSICDVSADDLKGFGQCHFFAGIGGWPYALSLASWPEDREVWTGSCPCQSISIAGKRKGADDERHLWPTFYSLIAKRKPSIVFGEQVAGALGCEWFAGVRADLEGAGYACGGADLCAAGVGAPHIRQRIFWCALANTSSIGRCEGEYIPWVEEARASSLVDGAGSGCVDNSLRGRHRAAQAEVCAGGIGAELSGWTDAEWLLDAEGKARRVKSGLPLLAHGLSNRVGRLRGFGNAIVPQVGAAFIQAVMDL